MSSVRLISKVFEGDRLVRRADGTPLGRVILAKDYVEGENVYVSLMEIPKSFISCRDLLKGLELYIDMNMYKVPIDLNDFKISDSNMKWFLNSFILPINVPSK
jgi:hypothetical protein